MSVNNTKGLINYFIDPYEKASFSSQAGIVIVGTILFGSAAYSVEYLFCGGRGNGKDSFALGALPFAVAAVANVVFSHMLGLKKGGVEWKSKKGFRKNIKKIAVRGITVLSGVGTVYYLTSRAPFTIRHSMNIIGLTALTTLFPIVLLGALKVRDKKSKLIEVLADLFVAAQACLLMGAAARKLQMKGVTRLVNVVAFTHSIGWAVLQVLKRNPTFASRRKENLIISKIVEGCVASVFGSFIFGLAQWAFPKLRFKHYESAGGVAQSCALAAFVGIGTWTANGIFAGLLNGDKK